MVPDGHATTSLPADDFMLRRGASLEGVGKSGGSTRFWGVREGGVHGAPTVFLKSAVGWHRARAAGKVPWITGTQCPVPTGNAGTHCGFKLPAALCFGCTTGACPLLMHCKVAG